MRIWLWFWLSCKRQLRRPGYLILLLLLPVCLFGAKRMEREAQEGIAIALYAEEDGLAGTVVEALTGGDSMFRFYEVGSKEELERDVAAQKAECGYLFYEGLEQKLKEENYNRSIGLCTSPSTMVASLSSEVVFAALMEEYGRTLLEDYAGSQEAFSFADKDAVWAELEGLFDRYLTNRSTFSFAYDTIDGGNVEEAQAVAGFPVRGVAAVMVFVAGIFGAVLLLEDEKKGLYIPVPYEQKLWCKCASILALVCMAACSGLVSLAVTGSLEHVGYEIMCMAVYAAAVTVFSYLLKGIVRNEAVICCLIPFFIIGSLILCPVFLDVGEWLPDIRTAQKLFLPYYYLKMF